MISRSVHHAHRVATRRPSRRNDGRVDRVVVRARPHSAQEYAIGADVSFLAQAEKNGIVFKDDGQAKPGLQIFKDHGYNWVRLRLFHSPTRLPNNLEYTIAQAQAAKKLGFKFLLNYHYSDTWADPQKQFLPKAWEGKSHEELVEAVFDYTRDTIAAFREAGVMPDMVQIGNEVIGGMMWPDGRLPRNWSNFADLVKAGIRGVDAGRGDAPRPIIMMHIDRGGSIPATKYFFDHCRRARHRVRRHRPVVLPVVARQPGRPAREHGVHGRAVRQGHHLVEVAYNWRTAEYRDEPGPFPETPEGQRQFLEEVDRIVRETLPTIAARAFSGGSRPSPGAHRQPRHV